MVDISVILMVTSAVFFHHTFDDHHMYDNCDRWIHPKSGIVCGICYLAFEFSCCQKCINPTLLIRDGDTSNDDNDQPEKAARH